MLCETWDHCSELKLKLLPLPAPENHAAPPDVTGYSSDSSHSHAERHHMSNMGTIARNTQKYGNAERMETGDGKTRPHLQETPGKARDYKRLDCLLTSLPWMDRLDFFNHAEETENTLFFVVFLIFILPAAVF